MNFLSCALCDGKLVVKDKDEHSVIKKTVCLNCGVKFTFPESKKLK